MPGLSGTQLDISSPDGTARDPENTQDTGRFRWCGRCWVRTNEGLADGFTGSPSLPAGMPADLRLPYSPPREIRVLSVWRP
jgi:hypothetical protein